MKLEEVAGQSQVTEPLIKSLKAGKLSHAYLFVGPRGCGKTSVARILAHEVNGFKYELEDDYVDIIEIDGASNRGIDNIRELREKVAIAPTSGKYKVYIIDEVHMLTKEAFNALLKTLEEPPAHVIFIMATTDAYKVPITITSRAQTYTFRLADASVMKPYLARICKTEGIKIADDALSVIVKRGGGSFRDSLSLLDQISTLSDGEISKELVISALGLPEDEKIKGLIDDYLSFDSKRITTSLKELLASGLKAETLVEELVAAIIDKPEPSLMPLLSRLAEIRAPFVEAKLLVALNEVPSNHFSEEPMNRGTFNSNSSESVNREVPDNHSSEPISHVDARDALPTDFDWKKFMETVRGMNDAIAMQLKSVEYMINGGTLDIFPTKRISKTILGRDNNKKILIDATGGLNVVVHDVGENPNTKKDELVSRISDIMGGEVQNDSGGNPF